MRGRRPTVAPVLPDHLAPGLRAVFVGNSVSKVSAERAVTTTQTRVTSFCDLLAARVCSVGFGSGQRIDARVVDYGVGLTDVVKRDA